MLSDNDITTTTQSTERCEQSNGESTCADVQPASSAPDTVKEKQVVEQEEEQIIPQSNARGRGQQISSPASRGRGGRGQNRGGRGRGEGRGGFHQNSNNDNTHSYHRDAHTNPPYRGGRGGRGGGRGGESFNGRRQQYGQPTPSPYNDDDSHKCSHNNNNNNLNNGGGGGDRGRGRGRGRGGNGPHGVRGRSHNSFYFSSNGNHNDNNNYDERNSNNANHGTSEENTAVADDPETRRAQEEAAAIKARHVQLADDIAKIPVFEVRYMLNVLLANVRACVNGVRELQEQVAEAVKLYEEWVQEEEEQEEAAAAAATAETAEKTATVSKAVTTRVFWPQVPPEAISINTLLIQLQPAVRKTIAEPFNFDWSWRQRAATAEGGQESNGSKDEGEHPNNDDGAEKEEKEAVTEAKSAVVDSSLAPSPPVPDVNKKSEVHLHWSLRVMVAPRLDKLKHFRQQQQRQQNRSRFTVQYLNPLRVGTSRLLRELQRAGARWVQIGLRARPDMMHLLQPVLARGIDVAGHRFHFLSISSAQMRCATPFAVFVDADPARAGGRTADEWRRYLMVSKPHGGVHAYVARLGLYHTRDVSYKCFAPGPGQLCTNYPDVYLRSGDGTDGRGGPLPGSLLTDGCGFVRRDLVKDILENEDCSLIQFRYRGGKGVLLVVDGPIPGADPECLLALRPSQMKVESHHSELCIVNEAKARRFTTDKDFLTVMTARKRLAGGGHGDLVARFNNTVLAVLMQDMLAMTQPFFSEADARMQLRTLDMAPQEWRAREPAFDVLQQPFLVELLWQRHCDALRSATLQMQVPVAGAVRLLGCADPYGLLNDGEVFACVELVRVRETGALLLAASDEAQELLAAMAGEPLGYRCVVGDGLVVFRNPSLHPGDLQLCRGVDLVSVDERYRAIRDVLLFPCNAETTTYSIPHRCAGGDLDGDEYSLVWDAALTEGLQPYEAAAYDATKRASSTTHYSARAPALASHIVRCLSNKDIGIISNLHITLSEILKDGAADPLALEVARQHAIAIDFPKTNRRAHIPNTAQRLRETCGIPDFMAAQKVLAGVETADVFRSSTVNGRVYRQHTTFQVHGAMGNKAQHLAIRQRLFAAIHNAVKTALGEPRKARQGEEEQELGANPPEEEEKLEAEDTEEQEKTKKKDGDDITRRSKRATQQRFIDVFTRVVDLWARHAKSLTYIMHSAGRRTELELFVRASGVSAEEQREQGFIIREGVRACCGEASRDLDDIIAASDGVPGRVVCAMLYAVTHFPRAVLDRYPQVFSHLDDAASLVGDEHSSSFQLLGTLALWRDPSLVVEVLSDPRIEQLTREKLQRLEREPWPEGWAPQFFAIQREARLVQKHAKKPPREGEEPTAAAAAADTTLIADVGLAYQLVLRWAVLSQMGERGMVKDYTAALSEVCEDIAGTVKRGTAYWPHLTAAALQQLARSVTQTHSDVDEYRLACARAAVMVLLTGDALSLHSFTRAAPRLVPQLALATTPDAATRLVPKHFFNVDTIHAPHPLLGTRALTSTMVSFAPFGVRGNVVRSMRWITWQQQQQQQHGAFNWYRWAPDSVAAEKVLISSLRDVVANSIGPNFNFDQASWTISGLFGVQLLANPDRQQAEGKLKLDDEYPIRYVDELFNSDKTRRPASVFQEVQCVFVPFQRLHQVLTNRGWRPDIVLPPASRWNLSLTYADPMRNQTKVSLDAAQRVVGFSGSARRRGMMLLLAPRVDPEGVFADDNLHVPAVPIGQCDMRVKFETDDAPNAAEALRRRLVGDLQVGEHYPLLEDESLAALFGSGGGGWGAMPAKIVAREQPPGSTGTIPVSIRVAGEWHEYTHPQYPGVVVRVGLRMAYYGHSGDSKEPRTFYRRPCAPVELHVRAGSAVLAARQERHQRTQHAMALARAARTASRAAGNTSETQVEEDHADDEEDEHVGSDDSALFDDPPADDEAEGPIEAEEDVEGEEAEEEEMEEEQEVEVADEVSVSDVDDASNSSSVEDHENDKGEADGSDDDDGDSGSDSSTSAGSTRGGETAGESKTASDNIDVERLDEQLKERAADAVAVAPFVSWRQRRHHLLRHSTPSMVRLLKAMIHLQRAVAETTPARLNHFVKQEGRTGAHRPARPPQKQE